MEFLGLFIQLGIFLGLIGLGLFVGGYVERRHTASLDRREAETSHMLVTQLKSFPLESPADKAPAMLCREVVISSDYLKTFLSAIRKLFGGELRSFQTLLDRARREALQRLKEDALRAGYDAVCNVRLETAAIAGRGTSNKNKIMMAAIMASGTAYCTSRNRAPSSAHE